MSSERLYLRPNLQGEPLVDQWYAWSHLIPPATAARNISERHLKILDSYIRSPQAHANAVRDPKMLGGPFIDYDGKRVDEIKALRDRTRNDRTQLLALSEALEKLADMLRLCAKGFSLQPLYASVPEILRGYVELVYDLDSNPSFRLLEPLLYRSEFYDRSLQSLMLSLTRGDDRSFVLSTPRLETEGQIHWRAPFSDVAIDRLFETETVPQPWNTIREILGEAADANGALLRTFFTTDRPRPYAPYEGPGARWRYFGHACILVEAANLNVLFDPVISYSYESNLARYTYRDLPDEIDYVVITHNHQDHILFETLLQLRHKIRNIVVPKNGGGALQDPSLKLTLKNVGFKNVLELEECETIKTPSGSITGVPFFGEHADLSIQTKLAYLIRVGRHTLLFAADSCNIEPRLYEHLYRELGPVDAVFLGMECDGAPLSWLYGPLATKHMDRAMDQSRRLSGSNYEQAMHIVNQFRCKEAYVYAMGQEPWLNYIMSIKYTEQSRPIIESNRLLTACREKGIFAERLYGEREILLRA